ncbi:hypothetical protein BgiMline_029349 [Biomphalaria glabrata]|nr:hypothetical protein BgiMline_029938 [Biomphalaria glabrata]
MDTTRSVYRSSYVGLLLVTMRVMSADLALQSYTEYPSNSKYLREKMAIFLLQRTPVSCAGLCFQLAGCAGFVYDMQSWSCTLGRGLLDYNSSVVDVAVQRQVYYMTGLPTFIACSSILFNITICPLPDVGINLTSVSLYIQFSKSPCTKDVTFGLNQNGDLWAGNGCRGMFSLDL